MTTLVTGSKSQLSLEIKSIIGDDKNFVFFDKNFLDIANEDNVYDIFKKYSPETVINTAAYTNVDIAEKNFEKAELINSQGPFLLSKYCSKFKSKLIHISTDYVFDGKKNQPYLSQDVTNPINNYGLTKRNGENNIINNFDNYIIIRTSWLYSIYKKNFVIKIINLLKKQDSINVVANEIGSPTWSRGLANLIIKIISNNCINGIYHYSDDSFCSRYDLAKEIYKICLKYNYLENKKFINPIYKNNNEVSRPLFSALDSKDTEKAFNYKIYNYKINLEKMIVEYFKFNV